jgi:2-dehydropantoate 2-reductase
MRAIIYGVGAIGGTLAAKLTLAGHEVVGIARGRQLDALRTDGLLFRTPAGDHRVHFPCFADPRAVGIGPDDHIYLTMKGQDTAPALVALAEAGVTGQPIFCFQNGVDNERQALRHFPNVYGVTVMLPGTFVEPGIVACFGMPRAGIFDIGRYPAGRDAVVDATVPLLNGAGFAAFGHERVMETKYGKLLSNLTNVLDAALGEANRNGRISDLAREEGRNVLAAAGIVFHEVGASKPRDPTLMTPQPIPGAARVGSSSAQSLARGTGSIETDYLNGEIVLLGRLHGVPTPVNAALCRLGHRLIAEKQQPGSLSVADVEAFVAAG